MDKLSEIEKPSKSIIDLDIVNDADIITEGLLSLISKK